jgi:hypothetical protein
VHFFLWNINHDLLPLFYVLKPPYGDVDKMLKLLHYLEFDWWDFHWDSRKNLIKNREKFRVRIPPNFLTQKLQINNQGKFPKNPQNIASEIPRNNAK